MEPISSSSASVAAAAVAQSTSSNVLKDTLCGLISGIAAKYVEYPFDTVKVRLQTDTGDVGHGVPASGHRHIRRYRNAWDCAVKTLKEEGIRGIYRGIFAPVVGSAAETAGLFVVYNRTQDFLYQWFPSSRLNPSSTSITSHSGPKAVTLPFVCVSGFVSGIFVAIVLTPIELVKCRLQVQELGLTHTKYKGVVDCAIQVIRTEGLGHGLFRGFSTTLLRDGPGTAAWFLAYESACRLFIPTGGTKNDLSPWHVMGAGAVAGISYWTAMFPADVVKSHQQTSCTPMTFSPTLQMLYRTQGGFRGLYRGWGVTVLRAAPCNATIFGVYELSRRVLDRYL